MSATSPAGEPHPGLIEFEDHVEHQTWTRKPEDVPVSMAWVRFGEHEWKPVIRIEIDGRGEDRQISKFGPDNELLTTTSARVPAPPIDAPE